MLLLGKRVPNVIKMIICLDCIALWLGRVILLDLFMLSLSCDLFLFPFVCNASLKTYAHDDVSVGSWMMGIQATYIDDNRLCSDKVCSLA
ncbi:hypothetical protein ACFX19_044343 [Malus domestica]